ncbi:flippase-like domain-containing protein [Candidatus Poribacteria bacterium]|nr:flippase-like domain-containing protein [Candidatus Poribacteria bacterium]
MSIVVNETTLNEKYIKNLGEVKIKAIKISIGLIFLGLIAFGLWRYISFGSLAKSLSETGKALSKIKLRFFFLAVLVYVISTLLTDWSWKAVLKIFNKHVNVLKLMPIWMAGIFVNNITPMSRAGGEIIRVYGLRKKFKMPYSVSVLSVAISKLTELAPIALMGMIGAPVLVEHKLLTWRQFSYIIGTMSIILLVAFLIIYKTNYMPILWNRILRLLTREEKNNISINSIPYSGKWKIPVFESLIAASFFWVMAPLRLKILAYAMDINLSFSAAAAVNVWYISMGLIAFTPGGIGIIEGGLVAGLVLIGVPPLQAFTLTVLDRSISYLLSTALGATCFLTLGARELWIRGNTKRGLS